MEQVYGGYVRSPEIRTWGRGSEWNPRKQNAGQIDYLAYGGESKNYYDNRAMDAIKRAKEKGYKPNYEGMDDYYKDICRAPAKKRTTTISTNTCQPPCPKILTQVVVMIALVLDALALVVAKAMFPAAFNTSRPLTIQS